MLPPIFPNGTYLAFVAGLASLIAAALPFSGWRGLAKNISIALVIAFVAIFLAVYLGAALHSLVFFEPTPIG